MGSEREREDRSVDDTDISQSVDLEFCVDDTALVHRQHGQGAPGMEFRFDSIEKERLNSLIGGDVGSGQDFLDKDFAEGEGLSNSPDQLDTLAHRHKISKVGQVLWVDDGTVERIARVDVNATLTEWMLEGDLDGESLLFGGRSTSGPQQDFKVSDTTQQELLRSSSVDALVAVDDALVLAGAQVVCRSIDHSEYLFLEGIG